MSSLIELSWQRSETGSLVGILLKYLPWQCDIYAFQRYFMSPEYPVIYSESNLLLLHYFSGNANFEFMMNFLRWCLLLHNTSKSCLVLISVKLYFIPKQSNLSLGVKVYKSLSIRNAISCVYFAAKILFFTLGEQQPLNITGTTMVSFHAIGEFSCFHRQWGQWDQLRFRELQGLGQGNHLALRRSESSVCCLWQRLLFIYSAVQGLLENSLWELFIFPRQVFGEHCVEFFTYIYSETVSLLLAPMTYSHPLGMFYIWMIYI